MRFATPGLHAPAELERLRRVGKTAGYRRIKSVEPVGEREVCCIEVAADDHLFLAGEAGVLTHNCNVPARHSNAAISEAEWHAARTGLQIPYNAHVGLGVDVAWKHDTFAIVPLWRTVKEIADDDLVFHVLGEAEILVPPRDGSTLHPNDVKIALDHMFDVFQVDEIVIDLERAEDIAALAVR